MINLTPYQNVLFFNVFVFSILIFASLLALVHYLYTSDKSYLFYSGYLASMFLYFLLDIVVLEYTQLFFPFWKNYVYILAVPINILPFYLYLRFANEFVFFQKFNPAIFRQIFLIAWFLLIYAGIDRILVHGFGRPHISLQVWFYVKVMFALFVLILIFQAFQTNNRLARVFATGTLCFVLGGLTKIYHEKFIQAPHLTTEVIHSPFFFMQLGVVLEILLFNVGLIYRSRLLNQEYTNLQLRQQETEKIRELNEFKTRFYTNITHEFRTPMTVILGICDHLKGQSQEKIAESVTLIKRNGEQLLMLVNEILVLSKAESSQLPSHCQTGDITLYLRYLTESFRPLSQSKMVALLFHTEISSLTIVYDAEKWQSILSNLLSNALKFTPANGQIRIELRLPAPNLFQLRISDSGTGISAQDLPHIFERYFQASNQTSHTGTGIGLSLVKEYVHAMNGTITAESYPGHGTTFTVTILLPAQTVSPPDVELLPAPPESRVNDNEKPVVLVVEDNTDVAYYLQVCLQETYRILTAANGQAGLEMARQHIPDLIISDVMMPLKDGYELCNQAKTDELTSHIPIILLTAKATQEHRMEGFLNGADAYIIKPFDSQELMIIAGKMIESRHRLRAKYRREWEVATPIAQTSILPSDPLLTRLKEVVEVHLDDSTFGVEQLAKAAHLSRSQLHRKLKAMTDWSAAHFIRHVRLSKAQLLLRTTHLSISEIAYAVGFDDPDYFSRIFSETIGETPTRFREAYKREL